MEERGQHEHGKKTRLEPRVRPGGEASRDREQRGGRERCAPAPAQTDPSGAPGQAERREGGRDAQGPRRAGDIDTARALLVKARNLLFQKCDEV